MKPAKCPFYPDSCTVEFHRNMEHEWIDKKRLKINLQQPPIEMAIVDMAVKAITNAMPRALKITNKASERAQAWNKANRKQYNARQKVLMAGKRAKRGG